MFASNNYLPHGNFPTATGSEGSRKCILNCAVHFQAILEAFQYSVELLPISHILVIFSLSFDLTKARAFLLWKVKLSYMYITCSLVLLL